MGNTGKIMPRRKITESGYRAVNFAVKNSGG